MQTNVELILSGDHKFVLNKVYENKLITEREYHNLKGIFKENVEGHVVELVDTIMEKGEDTCERFLRLLETDDEIKDTFPNLKTVQLSSRRQPTGLIHETCLMDNKGTADESYPVTSYPTGLCLILNNMNFEDGSTRRGTDKDAESLAEVFNWLGFRVLMCEDQTMLTLEHGDVFICCILTHGNKGIVYGTDKQPLSIKDITRTFRATDSSPLTAKPKVFLIQACQGVRNVQRGVIKRDLETDGESSVSVPEEADVLVAVATVEDYVSFRNTVNGSWFIQSLCQQLKEGCSRGDDIHSILQRVNSEVSQKEGNLDKPGQIKQMPEVHYTLTKKLILSGYHC
uniref:Caspase 20, apoptosis-related cysteine peptidase n=1 Tax=Periophthalmus magnuspinnatus TaxID=409849 RepID=A0A3B4B6K0_9GOBI